jgi:hypothetical protein
MGRSRLVVTVLVCTSPALAGPSVDLDLGIGLEHISGGLCDDGAHNVGSCDGRWGLSLQLEAGQAWSPSRSVSFVTREMIAGSAVLGDTWRTSMEVRPHTTALVRAYLGIGARVELSPQWAVELTGGEELQGGTTGTGDGGIATGHDLALAPRLARRTGCWAFALEAMVAPGAFGDLGLSEMDVTVLFARTFSN